jgi:hypothetical protein
MFTKEATKVTSLSTSMSDETVHPLPSLFRLLGKEPFKKAWITLRKISFSWSSVEVSFSLSLLFSYNRPSSLQMIY